MGERPTVREAEALVQAARGLEGRRGAGFEAELSVRALASLDNYVLQHRTRHTFAPMCGCSAHRLDFTVGRTELFQRTTPEQFALRPNRPESNFWLEKTGEVERMHALGRRELLHVVKMLGKKRADFRASEVINSNLHDQSGLCVYCGLPA